MKKYFPILVSKKGELVALQHLTQHVKDEISPIIEVLSDSLFKVVRDKEAGTERTVPSDAFEKYMATHWGFFENQVMLDFSLFKELRTRIDHVSNLIVKLREAGVNVVPTIQKNSEIEYLNFVRDLVARYSCKVCIRTSNNSGGYLNFNSDVMGLLEFLKMSPSNVCLLLDLGQVDKDDFNIKAAVAGFAIQTLRLPLKDWSDVIIASSSFPENLTNIKRESNGFVCQRYEWEVWKTLAAVESLKGIRYGDYGTKHSSFSELAFRGTVSLKYTTRENFIIYRGEISDSHEHGHGQYITHAKKLVANEHYSGKDFSWGDLRFYEISQEKEADDNRKTGNATNWVQNSQNHHVSLLHSLL